jgi:4-hydroxybenzoate polyprenyltransferase
MLLLKDNVFYLFLLPFWLLKGKANLKNQIAARVELEAEFLPYNQEVVDFVKAEKARGRECYLATGTVEKFAQAIAGFLGCFDGVFATTAEINLTGSNKAELLNQRFGSGQYDYLGNHAVDLKLWAHSDVAIVVSNSTALLKKAEGVAKKTQQIKPAKATLKTFIKAIRVHQWVKNALIFVPLLTAHAWQDADLILRCLLGFLAYSLAASSVYVLNDLLDLPSDRAHPSKKERPFAKGTLSILTGLIVFPLFLLSAFAIAWYFTPLNFVYALLVYYIITVAYSFNLKRIIMLDTVVLALLYTMRIIAGTVLIEVDFSFWLLAFSMFIFLSLALLKRYTELVLMQESGNKKTIGRGYYAADAPMVSGFGTASAYISVLVLALYVDSPDVVEMYREPYWLWLVCPVMLYWISRAWLIAHRGNMHDDPIVFAVKDRQSLLVGIIVFAIFLWAS